MPIQKAVIDLGPRAYAVYVGTDIQNETNLILGSKTAGRSLFVVTDAALYPIYVQSFIQTLREKGWDVHGMTIPSGEKNRSLEQVEKILSEFVHQKLSKDTLVVCIGGGSIADVCGYAASQFLGGLPYINIATTLQGMVDGCIGGYHALNYGGYKDQISCVYQPKSVICDVARLHSLPENEFANGLAEIIKLSVAKDPVMFGFLEANLRMIKNRDNVKLQKLVARAIAVKALYIRADEKNVGPQQKLDLGHTVGHALESISDFQISHGEALSVGLLTAARVSMKLNQLPYAEYHRIKALLTECGLPTSIGDYDIEKINEAIMHDRKVHGQTVNYILPLRIGKIVSTEKITLDMIDQAIGED